MSKTLNQIFKSPFRSWI